VAAFADVLAETTPDLFTAATATRYVTPQVKPVKVACVLRGLMTSRTPR